MSSFGSLLNICLDLETSAAELVQREHSGCEITIFKFDTVLPQ